MRSSKDRELSSPPDEDDRQLAGRRRLLRAVLGVILIALAIVALRTDWSVYSIDSDLTRARELLTSANQASTSQEARLKAAEDVVLLLRDRDGNDDVQRSQVHAYLTAAYGILDPKEISAHWERVEPGRLPQGDLLLLADLLFHVRQFGLADQIVEQALATGTQREETLRLASLIRYEIGREEDVLKHCRELAELNPEDARPWVAMAQVYKDRTYWPQAAEVYREALQRSHAESLLRWELTDMLVKAGEAVQAREQFDKLPGLPDALEIPTWLLEAELLFLEGQHEASLERVSKFLTHSPDHPEAALLKGRLLLAGNQLEEALQTLLPLVEAAPADHEAHYTLGQTYARLGKRELAEKHLTLQRELLDKKVKLYQLEREAGRNPTDPEVREELARLYAEIGLPQMEQFWRNAAQALRAVEDR